MGLLPKGCIPPKAAKTNRIDNSKSAYMRLACVKYRLRFSGQLVEILDYFGKLLRIYANTVYLRKSVVNMATATTTFPPKQNNRSQHACILKVVFHKHITEAS